MLKSDSIAALAEALAKAQGEILGAKKDSENPFFKSKYADLASVRDACRDPFAKNGLAVVQTPHSVISPEVTIISVETILAHSSGEWISEELSAVPVKDDPQGIGSCITYLRRYALASFAGVAPEDDDGNAASQPGQPQRARTAQRTAKPEAAKGNGEQTVEPTAEVVALREQIKKAMAALNEAGDKPEWTVDRVNKMVRENFNGKITAHLTVHELNDLAQMFSQRLSDLRTNGNKERESILLEIRGAATEDKITEYLGQYFPGKALETLTIAELKKAETDLTIPF